MKLYGALETTPQALLTCALETAYQISPLPCIARTSLGKPYLSAHPDIHINWSHSGAFVLCALSEKPIGVDIEMIRPRGKALPRYALTPEEYAVFLDSGGDWPSFYTLWTRKEAWCKYTGDGLRRRWGETPPTKGLFFRTYAGECWRATVCGEETPPEKICWMEVP